jgi:hypothetical protein
MITEGGDVLQSRKHHWCRRVVEDSCVVLCHHIQEEYTTQNILCQGKNRCPSEIFRRLGLGIRYGPAGARNSR